MHRAERFFHQVSTASPFQLQSTLPLGIQPFPATGGSRSCGNPYVEIPYFLVSEFSLFSTATTACGLKAAIEKRFRKAF